MDLHAALHEALKAKNSLLNITECQINHILLETAAELELQSNYILSENHKDLSRMEQKNPKYDRLRLTPERIRAIAADMRNVATLPSPVGRKLQECRRPNGMIIRKISVPFGLVGVIYEARPNVTADVFSLCLKSGNVCVLKGGSDAGFSNAALVSIIHNILDKNKLNKNTCTLLPPHREATTALLEARGIVDIIIPRGSASLIHYVREHAKVPVIETGAGICHTYFHTSGETGRGAAIVNNAKTRRVSVCNALDCLVIDRARLKDLPAICAPLEEKKVIIYADAPAYGALAEKYPFLERAREEHYGTEFLDYKMSIKTVENIDQALEHIQKYSSGHSEAIIAEEQSAIDRFLKTADAACVYANASTAFTDGAQFGLGAEIGISTQKLHARGPMALEALNTYKYLIEGNGQIRTV